MDPREETVALLKAHGATLDRTRKHQVWHLPDGRAFTMPSTPSDPRSGLNTLRQVRQFLGVAKEAPRKNPNRKPKKGVGKPRYQAAEPAPLPNWRNKLSGLFAAFPSHTKPPLECFPLDLEVCYMTPFQAILKHFLDWR